jgi:toxin-antitoxin system PIN domain toxin
LIAVDTNILVYAHASRFPLHEAARTRLAELAEGRAAWAVPVFCIAEFARVMTHPRLFQPPWTAEQLRRATAHLLASPSLRVLCPSLDFPRLLLDAIVEANSVGNLVFDAQVVALCRESSVTRLLTEDRDFGRFAGLDCEHLPRP